MPVLLNLIKLCVKSVWVLIFQRLGHKCKISFCCPLRTLSLISGKSCVINWTHWPQTATNTEPRRTRGSSGLCSGTCSRLLRWASSQLMEASFASFNLQVVVLFSSHPSVYSPRRVTSSRRRFALGQSVWPLTAGSERGHTMPSESLWALGWTTTYRYFFKFGINVQRSTDSWL